MGWWGIGTYNSGLTVVRGTGWMLSAFMTVRRFCFNSSELRPRLLLEDEAHLASSWKSWWTKDTLRSLKWRKIILVQQDEAKVFKDSELSYSCYSLELAPGGCTAPSHLQLAGPGQNLKRNIQNGAIFFSLRLQTMNIVEAGTVRGTYQFERLEVLQTALAEQGLSK